MSDVQPTGVGPAHGAHAARRGIIVTRGGRLVVLHADDLVGGRVQPLVCLSNGRVLDDLECVGLVVGLHGVLQLAGQVVIVPPSLDDEHAATRSQAGVGRGGIPLPELLAQVGALRLLSVLDRVVDGEDVSALARDTAAHTGGHVAAAVTLDGPLLSGLEVRVQAGVEDRLVDWIGDDLLDLAAEGHGQGHVVRAGDEFVVRAAPQMPGREHAGRQLALAVARRHEQHQARTLALLHLTTETFQAPTDVLVNPSRQVAWVDLLGEGQQAPARQHPVCQLLASGIDGAEGARRRGRRQRRPTAHR